MDRVHLPGNSGHRAQVLTADQHPYFTVINEFRLLNLDGFKDLFVQVLELCGNLLKLVRSESDSLHEALQPT